MVEREKESEREEMTVVTSDLGLDQRYLDIQQQHLGWYTFSVQLSLIMLELTVFVGGVFSAAQHMSMSTYQHLVFEIQTKKNYCAGLIS